MFNKQDNVKCLSGTHPDKQDTQKILGDKFYFDFLKIAPETLLDWILFEFFDRCYLLNRALAQHGYFLKFFERRSRYRFMIKKKKTQGKNDVTTQLSTCVLKKFNGHEVIRYGLTRKEKVDFIPINVVYEPSYDESVPVTCNLKNQIHQVYKSYVGRFDKGKERISNKAIKRCQYCQKSFSKNELAMKKHLSICGAKKGITYSFDDGQILDYQGNFKDQGNLPFVVYFDIETTTGNVVFLDPKMYVVSYCQIYSFHPSINLDKIVIYKTFPQTSEQIYDLIHFRKEHAPFFNGVSFRQLKDAASAVLAREKSASLAELFSIELKFTVDTLKGWFNSTIKPKFFEIDSLNKMDWRQKKNL